MVRNEKNFVLKYVIATETNLKRKRFFLLCFKSKIKMRNYEL